jgi:hypothetical protein
MERFSAIYFLNQTFHLVSPIAAGLSKLNYECSPHDDFRIWLFGVAIRGHFVDFMSVLCRRSGLPYRQISNRQRRYTL